MTFAANLWVLLREKSKMLEATQSAESQETSCGMASSVQGERASMSYEWQLTPARSGSFPMTRLDFTMIGTQSDVAHAPLGVPPVTWPIRTEVAFKPLHFKIY
jgi:hypothetical protein